MYWILRAHVVYLNMHRTVRTVLSPQYTEEPQLWKSPKVAVSENPNGCLDIDPAVLLMLATLSHVQPKAEGTMLSF
jgi:hypothetical protein